MKYFRADIRPTTNTVPHGAPSEMADGSSCKGKRALEEGNAGISKSLQSDKAQPGDVSTTSPSSKKGVADDSNEQTANFGVGL